VLLLNKDTETLENISAPLGGLDHLQSQAQEHIASAARQPLVKFTGITPSGLNASSDGEIRCFYDTTAANQEAVIRPVLTVMLKVLQLNLWGKIDPDIGVDFEPLWESSEVERATVRKTEADTAAVYINAGVLTPDEERQRLASEDGSAYSNLDMSVEIEPPADPSLMQPDADGGWTDATDPPPAHTAPPAPGTAPPAP
jgi:uncharacterized protein